MRKAAFLIITIIIFCAGCANNLNDVNTGMPIDDKRMQPIRGGSVNIGIGQPVSIDPIDYEEQNGILIGGNLFDSLTDIDPKTMQVIPAAASSWQANDDLTVWTFSLKKNALFHNQRPVTAADFKYAWERIVAPGSASMVDYHLKPIVGYDELKSGRSETLTGVKAIDDYTLEVSLKYGFADFAVLVSNPTLAPVPKEEVERDEQAFAKNPVGNGPFKMAAAWDHGNRIRLERFDKYEGAKPYLDTVDFVIFPDEQSAYDSFKKHELDFSIAPLSEAVKEKQARGIGKYEARDGQRYLSGSELGVFFFGFNVDSEFYRNHPEVMKAISLAIDRQAIVDDIFGGCGFAAASIVPPGIPGYNPQAGEYTRYDLNKASVILAQAGFKDGIDEEGDHVTVTISINNESANEQVAEKIKSDLKKIGIEAVIVNREWETFLSDTAHGKIGFFRLGWMADYPIQDNFLTPLYYSKNIPDATNEWLGDNRCRYDNSEVDALLEKARSEADQEARINLYRQAEERILDDAACVPLFFLEHRHAVSDRVYSLTFDALKHLDLSKVWVIDAPVDSKSNTD